MPPPPPLTAVVAALREVHGEVPPPPTRDAFELILRENAAYLVDDGRRDATFAELKRRIGTTPGEILAAKPGAIEAAIADGGMRPPMRAEKLRTAARLADGLEAALDRGGKEAMKALKRFPGIGEPGAETILLLTGRAPVLALDSNGMRVLLRLGYGRDEGNYGKTYRSVRAAVGPEVPNGVKEVERAHLLLRAHGKSICRRTAPLCGNCPLNDRCPSVDRLLPRR